MISFWLSMLFLSSGAHASEVQTQTTVGTGLVSEEISYNGDTKSEDSKKKGGLTWDFSYTYTSITLGATTTSVPVPPTAAASDHTSAITGGFGYSDKWEVGLDLNYSKTPEEGLDSFGPSIRLGYTFDLGPEQPKKKSVKKVVPKNNHEKNNAEDNEDADTDEPFMPTFKVLATLGTTSFNQDISTTVRAGTRRRAAVTKPGKVSIVQKQAEIDFDLSAVEWLDVDISLTKYGYNRDVGTFLASLDDPRAISSGAANLGSTLEGFSTNDAKIDFIFHLPYDIEINPEFGRSTSAVDGSKVNTEKIDVSKLGQKPGKQDLLMSAMNRLRISRTPAS